MLAGFYDFEGSLSEDTNKGILSAMLYAMRCPHPRERAKAPVQMVNRCCGLAGTKGRERGNFRYAWDGEKGMDKIIEKFAREGGDFTACCQGGFSFALWQESGLYLFRDPLGLKPLFYTLLNGRLIFAASIRGILTHPGVEAVLDTDGLAQLFALGPARYEHSGVFRHIRALPPGYFLLASQKEGLLHIQLERYWDFPQKAHTHSEAETLVHVRELLKDAVSRRIFASNMEKTCALLSGGIDSSVITAIAAEAYKDAGQPLKTFSFDFADSAAHFKANAFQPGRDRPWVDKMAAFCQTQHTYLECSPADLAGALYAAVDARDLPGMADVDASLLYFCGKIANEGITHAFTGECADEIFGGYPWFHGEKGEGFPWSRDFKTRTALLTDEWINDLQPEATAAQYAHATLLNRDFDDEEEKHLSRQGYHTLKWFMPALLERMQRMGGYSGIAGVLPFADVKLMEYVWNIPWAMKRKGGVVKYVLREAARGLVPEEVLFRKKSPFPKTYDPAYTDLLAVRLQDLLTDTAAPVWNFLDTAKTRQFITQTQAEPNLSRPWFGQLMAGPQMMAYILQIDYWMRRYKVRLVP